MPTPRYYLGSGILNEFLYAVGGYNDSIALSSVEAYDPTIQSWTSVTPMPTPRLPSVAVVDGALYAIGGYDVHRVPLSTFEAFTPTTPGAAELNGGNTFTGNQTVNGNVTATNFVGNGSGLTGVNAASLAGVPASNFARLDVGNVFTGNQAVNGTLSATSFVGDGSALTGITTQTANTANSANTANFAVSAGDSMTLGGNLPGAFAPASALANYVSKSGDTMSGSLDLPANGLIAGTNQFVLSGGNVGIGTASPGAGLLWSQMGYPTRLHLQNAGFNMSAVQATSTGSSAILYAEGRTNGCAECGSGGGLLGLADTAAAPNSRILDIISWGGKMQFRRVSDDYTQQLAVPLTIDYTSNTNGNVGIGTHSPTATLEVNGTAKFGGAVTFAPGQTFPGVGNGTITGVTAGSGLSGGGSSGNITLANTGLLSLTAGNGILSTGGQSPTVSLNTSFTDGRYLPLTGGTLTGGLAAASFSGNGSGLTNLNPANLSAGTAGINISGNASTASNALALGGMLPGSFATTAYVNNPNNIYSGWHQAEAVGSFLVGLSDQGKLITTGQTNVTLPASIPPIAWWVDIENHGPTSITLNPNGNNLDYSPSTLTLAANQGLRVVSAGSNPPGYFTQRGTGSSLSMTFNLSIPSLKPSTCTLSTFTFTGASDGDTTAMGVPNALMVTGNVIYSAWVNAANSVTVRACNVNPNGPATTAASGTVRVDIWKH